MLHIGNKVRLSYNRRLTGIVKGTVNKDVTIVQLDNDGKFYDLMTDKLEIIEDIQHVKDISMDSWKIVNTGTIARDDENNKSLL